PRLPRKDRAAPSLSAARSGNAVPASAAGCGPLVARTEDEREARQERLQQAESDFDALPFDAAAARAFGRVAASLRRSRRKPAARACDANDCSNSGGEWSSRVHLQPSRLTGIDD